jgi:hypothetical protein
MIGRVAVFGLALVAGCGRLGFDPIGVDGATGATSDSASDAALSAIAQRAYVKASNTAPNDWFGSSVALSADGTTLAVGARFEDSAATGIGGNQADDTASDAGAVYVFTHVGTSWIQQAYLKASNAETNDLFGCSVALSADGSTLAVGAFAEKGGIAGINGNQADNSAGSAGAAFVFTRAGTAWTQQAYIKSSNPNVNDQFGRELALSADGSTLAVAAVDEDSASPGIGGNQADNSAAGAGAAYVFTRTGVIWTQQAYIKASNPGSNDLFATTIALSGDGSTLAIGAIGERSAAMGVDGNQADDTAFFSGAVYVFSRAGSVWTQQAFVKPSNTNGGDAFGAGVSLSADGSTLAVGAQSEASGVVGNQADNSAAQAGAAYVFTRAGLTWSQQAYLKASNVSAGDEFRIVVLSGDGATLAVGGWLEDSTAAGINGNEADDSATNAGAVYVFNRAGATWTQQSYVKASNVGAVDFFGEHLAMSADGSVLAAVAHGESSAELGVGGTGLDNTAPNAGAVYVFE